jgi:hypothetical protein
MPTLIRDRNAVRGAELEDLNHTYRELKGEPDHPGFTNRTAAEVQVTMAMMAAEDAAGHRGVPKGSKPVAATAQELASNPYKPGTMSHELYDKVNAQAPITPRPKKAEAPNDPATRRVTIHRVRATFAGTSKPHAGSVRNNVLLYVQAAPEHTCSVAELEEHFKMPVRGYLQKLVEKAHLEILPVEGEQ